MQTLIERILSAHCGVLADARHFRLPGCEPPWRGTGIRVRAGQAYTLLGSGRLRWSANNPDLHGGPGFHLWARVSPGGEIVNVVRDSGSFVADVDGEVELGIYFGTWRDTRGTLDSPAGAYARLEGALEVIVLAWTTGADAGLAALASDVAHPLIDTERDRVAHPVELPPGWSYLRETGTSDIYRDCAEGGTARMCVEALDDQGIVRKPVDVPLEADTVLSWRWKVDVLPSALAEDRASTHDYVSIATEFDNGRDLTWLWSSVLPPGHHFHCPIAAWTARETHWVVRTGGDALGRWCAERRPVHTDVAAAMGPPPARITAVWLITVATFQHGRAVAAFEDVCLSHGAETLSVL